MPLPPRIESTADDIHAPASLTTQPVASPETTAQQAFAPHEADAPHIADEIAAGTAGAAAVAGLGAVGFGALKLDFDLELPPSPAQPLPVFTPTDLKRIARNKLELASEYIELGDLSGARTLINEVIEANDPATRTEARALLSTLAPLS
jgi:pilus assembly protein FimV